MERFQPPADAVRAIVRRHALADEIVLRLFPRQVDAVLIGMLKLIVDGRYDSARIIRAKYGFKGSRVWVSDVEVDGRAVPGNIDLSATATTRRKGCS